MRIGYASLALGVPNAKAKSLRLNNATDERLKEIINSNLNVLDNLLDYNNENDIKMFRISSDIIPFGSHPKVSYNWRGIFEKKIKALGEKARQMDIRLSMHPGQYTVLNSPTEDVVERAVEDLEYHCDLLDMMGMDSSCKIILHIGGVYGDKEKAIERFKENYLKLNHSIKQRLIIENDDRNYNIDEVIAIGKDLSIPVVFDNLHNKINPGKQKISESELITKSSETWGKQDGRPKIHYSQQAIDRKPGSHSFSIDIGPFLDFVDGLDCDVDIMLEVKDKNLSAKKCILCTKSRGDINELEEEWARYKYVVLERDPDIYNQIKDLLKDKASYPAIEFYQLIEKSLDIDTENGRLINAAQHIMGYFKNKASDKEKNNFQMLVNGMSDNIGNYMKIKRLLYRLSEKYDERYLLRSYYFIL